MKYLLHLPGIPIYNFYWLVVLLVTPASSTFSQQFVPPIDVNQIMLAELVHVVTINGDTIIGKPGSMSGSMDKRFSRLTIKADEAKHKLKSDEIKHLSVKVHPFTIYANAYSIENLKRLLDEDFEKMPVQNHIFFDRIRLPGKKEDYQLCQLVNPGFDRPVRVYCNPFAGKTGGFEMGGVQFTGGDERSYYLVRPESDAILVKKSKYKKNARSEIFGDCRVFQKIYEDEKLDWAFFAEHIYVYNKLCSSN